ncbi:hypothetical protein DB30_02553 [Enhygromyxa salina]|uniref:Uncharacterized protein n=1 Tax=Enhygromyxa salina TaxID=215803 RepID=A0A0C1ZLU3_9BACT|nr:hypothetical protein [Enhygromyxa salina]KIG11758.1 hypothetical protein DB30_02553 [Enhygromyxa salina]
MTLPFASGCKKQKYDVETTSPANAGQVQIVLSLDKTGNGKITFAFEHLPPPQRVDDSLKAYVVWGTADGKDPYKIGVLNYNAKKRSGTLEATFADDRLTVLVTLEEDPSVPAPVGARVLEQVVVAPKK